MASVKAGTALALTTGRAVQLRLSQPQVSHGSLVDFWRATSLQSESTSSGGGGTACACVCGDRVVWNRKVFEGNVVAEKEHECEHKVCPMVNVPGLKVTAQCNYVSDITELTEGTVCTCQCGDKLIWRRRSFHGNRVEELEKYCLKTICPEVSPIPGLRFEAQCHYNKHLFREPRVAQPSAQGLPSGTRQALTILDAAISLGLAILGMVVSGVADVLI